MKENFKLAIQLAKPELRISWGSFIGLFLFYSLFAFLIISGLNAQENRFAGLDLFFFMLFLFGPIWFKPKGLQYQKISGTAWGSPSIMMGLNLPIKREVMILRSIILYFISSFPFQLYLLIMLYVFSPAMREMIEPNGYIAFVLIWLSFSIYGGFSVPSSELVVTKMKINTYSVLSIILIILGIILIIFFPFFFTYGIVEWTIILAKKWSIASALISIVLAIVGMFFWKNKMVKQLNKVDYL